MVSTGVTFSGALRRPVWCVARVVGDTQRRPGGREKRGQRSSPARTDRQGAWLRRTTATVPQASSPAARPIARWSGKRRPRSATAVRWKARAQWLRVAGARLASANRTGCPKLSAAPTRPTSRCWQRDCMSMQAGSREAIR